VVVPARRLLASVALLSFDAMSDFDGAARIYRRCRARILEIPLDEASLRV
jgi:hypothetical protein